MAIGLPVKANYAAGDILTATNMNDLSGTFNNVATSYGNAAGKNKIINGHFGIWQRGTSFSNPAAFSYLADRWMLNYNGTGATRTISQQTFTPGTAPVAGYEGQYFFRYAQTVAGSGTTYSQVEQRIEDVRTFAGQTVTISFWAKMASGTASLGTLLFYNYGSGGSADASSGTIATSTVTTAWQRFTVTTTVASVSGKTIGASSWLGIYFQVPQNAVFTLDLWGVQVEAGSIATPFQTASGGSIQGELAMCQRYYVKFGLPAVSNSFVGQGGAISATKADITLTLPVQQRVGATSIDYSGLQLSDRAGSPIAVSSIAQLVGDAGQQTVEITVASGLTQYRNYWMQQTATTSYLAFNAEL